MVVLLRLIQRCSGGGSSGGRSGDTDADTDLYGPAEAVLFAIGQPFRVLQTLALASGGDFSVAVSSARPALSALVLTGLPLLSLTAGSASVSVLTAARAVYAENGWRGFFAGFAGRALRHCSLVLAFLAAARLRRWLLARRAVAPPKPLAGAPSRVVFPSAVYCLAGQLLHPLAAWEVATVAAAAAAAVPSAVSLFPLSYSCAPVQSAQEIQRFESVHPSIYAIYDLIEAIDDRELQDSIRDHVVCIEDSFVNSQEWTLSRNVPELKLGVIGSVHSGKSALVHRYLTGSYMQDESPEAAACCSSATKAAHPISSSPAWCDACLFVFALDNADSFDAVYQFYNRMSQYRNLADMPICCCESRPRVIDEAKTRKCAQDLRRCVYLETCATYGHNVDRVFQEACHRIVTSQQAWKKPSAAQTPGQQQQQPGGSHMNARGGLYNVPPPGKDPIGQYYEPPVQSHPMHSFGTPVSYQPLTPPHPMLQQQQQQQQQHGKPVKKSDSLLRDKAEEQQLAAGFQHADYSAYYASASVPSIAPGSCQLSLPPPPPLPPHHQPQPQQQQLGQRVAKDRSSFAQGSQGSLYKKAVNALNREWKKKYVTLSEDGKLTYHPNLHDYMENSHGKDIDLSRTTVKIPGQLRPTSNGLLKSQQQQQQQPEDGNKKRRHRRAKSGNRGGGGGGADQDVEESDGYEFMIVSLENRTWHFEAASQEERDEWPARPVSLRQLRHQRRLVELPRRRRRSGGGGSGGGSSGSGSIRGVFGNSECADCGRPGPDWASLNLGALVCIECSGVHRQLGTHLSRIRSLTLDDWPANHLLVMRAIGNKLANSVWEARLPCHATFRKPSPESDREAKEIFIRAKYERREFLPDLPFRDSPVQQQLVDAIARSDTRQVILCLAVAGPAVNEPYSKQDPRAAIHIAATLGQLVYLQLLLWHGADVAIRDAEGRNAHFYATAAGKPDCAEFLRAARLPSWRAGIRLRRGRLCG
uniref:G domain-containing protein n=1 Tax=Macrostomum lignano TaxID=282301 RepID=A0A1I8HIC8_9PLAT